VYLDAAYIAKYYVNESDSVAVRSLVIGRRPLVSSAICIAEVASVFHRHAREGRITTTKALELTRDFVRHVDSEFWILVPVTKRLLRRVATQLSATPATLFLRAGDAIHLITAQNQSETEIWTNDRHLLAAAPHFGLTGRSV